MKEGRRAEDVAHLILGGHAVLELVEVLCNRVSVADVDEDHRRGDPRRRDDGPSNRRNTPMPTEHQIVLSPGPWLALNVPLVHAADALAARHTPLGRLAPTILRGRERRAVYHLNAATDGRSRRPLS